MSLVGKKVLIDGDTSLVATVIGYRILDRRTQVQISWVHNGDIKEAYIDRWRVAECMSDESESIDRAGCLIAFAIILAAILISVWGFHG